MLMRPDLPPPPVPEEGRLCAMGEVYLSRIRSGHGQNKRRVTPVTGGPSEPSRDYRSRRGHCAGRGARRRIRTREMPIRTLGEPMIRVGFLVAMLVGLPALAQQQSQPKSAKPQAKRMSLAKAPSTPAVAKVAAPKTA